MRERRFYVPRLKSVRDYKTWLVTMKRRAFALRVLTRVFNSIRPPDTPLINLYTAYRLFYCPHCNKTVKVDGGKEQPKTCVSCQNPYPDPIRVVVLKWDCPKCGQRRAFDGITLIGYCKCGQFDLLGFFVVVWQKVCRSDDARFIKAFFDALLNFYTSQTSSLTIPDATK